MSSLFRSLSLCLATCILTYLNLPTASADSIITFGGDYSFMSRDGFGYDGTDYISVPDLFDESKLTGGKFIGSYFVPTAKPPTNYAFNSITYSFPKPYGFTFSLYDAQGNVVVEGSGPTSGARASVDNNGNLIDFNNNIIGKYDLVELDGKVSSLTGLSTPAPLYGPPDLFIGYSGFRFNSFSTPSIFNYINDLNLPTDPAVYLSFPGRTFSTGAFWGSGDYNDQNDPFLALDNTVFYNINRVSVTTVVPEPSSIALFVAIFVSGAGIALRRRRRVSMRAVH